MFMHVLVFTAAKISFQDTRIHVHVVGVDAGQEFNTYQLAFPTNMAVNDKLNLIAVTLLMDIIQDKCPCKVFNRSNSSKCCGMYCTLYMHNFCSI